jgi:hypothetical protein
MNTETLEKTEQPLTTADFAQSGGRPVQREPAREDEQLAALFSPEVANDFRSRWDAVQIGFVDDPGQSVHKADELVAQVMQNLAESFAAERQRLEQQMAGAQGGASTENLRVAIRRYRSFFQRLLSL